MSDDQGRIVLMGSGELTSTMVEVHKSMLRQCGPNPKAVFMDTPAGFQLNADHISQKAVEYFNHRVQHNLGIASFKSAQNGSDPDTAEAYAILRKADYILIGPGSPTYALQQWQQSSVPGLMIDRIEAGGCLVAASAAALTVGRFTLPVYEIYKVGQPVHWVDGLDLLGHFGFDLVVIPHWNNAEGGNHDTRYCFMGEPRIDLLESLLPETSPLLGLDEHTALIIDLAQPHATIEGVGRVTLRSRGRDQVFSKGDRVPMSLLRGDVQTADHDRGTGTGPAAESRETSKDASLWTSLHQVADNIRDDLDRNRDEKVAGAVLDLERLIWQSQKQLEELNEMGAAREMMREIIALLAARLSSRPADSRACLKPLADALVDLREQFRRDKNWGAADAVRDCLLKVDIRITDTPDGATWETS